MKRTIFVAVLLGLALAQEVSSLGMVDGKRAIHDSGWGRFTYEFEPKPNGDPEDYQVYALSRNPRPGVQMKPLLGLGSQIANTAPTPVELRTNDRQEVRVRYTSSQVAYLEVEFEVGVQRGTLSRNGQPVAEVAPGASITFGWGLAWVGTFGLVGVFAWPNNSTTLTYTEAVPLDASPFTLAVGGGGGCLAFSGAHQTLTVNPSQLQAGQLYRLKAGITCGGLFQGNRSYIALVNHDLIGLRVEVDGSPLPPAFPNGYRESGYAFSATYRNGYAVSPIMWENNQTGYFARGFAFDRNLLPLNGQLPPADTWAVEYNLTDGRTCIENPETGVETCTGEEMWPLPAHPTLGPTAIHVDSAGNYTLLQRQGELFGSASFTPRLGVNVLSVSTREERQPGASITTCDYAGENCQTVVQPDRVRQVMDFVTDSAPPTHTITVRLNRVTACTPAGSGFVCGPYEVQYQDNAWQWIR